MITVEVFNQIIWNNSATANEKMGDQCKCALVLGIKKIQSKFVMYVQRYKYYFLGPWKRYFHVKEHNNGI